jgi:3-phenylpropionate/trans-cinnamate dioxygenase ferredoxin subunit
LTDLDAEEMTWINHGAVSDLSARRMSRQVVAGTDILLCWSQGVPFAYLNQCTHLSKPLDGGRLVAGQIQCPFHGASFDVRSGAALCGPAVSPLQRIPVKIEGACLHFDTPPDPPPSLPKPGVTA